MLPTPLPCILRSRQKNASLVTKIFDGKNCFILTDNGGDTTQPEHKERFSGLLVPAFRRN